MGRQRRAARRASSTAHTVPVPVLCSRRLAESQVRTEERFPASERIDRLTSAIGEFIRRLPEPRA